MPSASADTPSTFHSPRVARAVPTLVHSGGTARQYYVHQFQGGVFPLTAGLLLYGRRAFLVMAVVVVSTALTTLIWQRIGRRGRDLSLAHACWLALLLALALPAHLGSLATLHSPHAGFWILPAAGALLAIVLWTLRGSAGTALHPVVVTYLILVPMFQQTLVPHYVLHPERLFVGDVLDAPAGAAQVGVNPWWYTRSRTVGHDAIQVAAPASESLLGYTLGRRDTSGGDVLLIQSLLRDRLPPLEDLVMAGNPGPIGASSVIFVIVGGLFLLYRGVINYQIPVFVIAAAFVALLVLPIPVAITDAGPRWAWLALREPAVGWAVAVTFAHYELFASPLLFMACFLATAPMVRPLTRQGRTLYAIALGLAAAAAQLYVSVAWGPYLALLVVGLLTPVVDRMFKPRVFA